MQGWYAYQAPRPTEAEAYGGSRDARQQTKRDDGNSLVTNVSGALQNEMQLMLVSATARNASSITKGGKL